MKHSMVALVSGAVLLAPAAVRAEDHPHLRYDPALDGTVAIAGGALWIASELLKGSIAPSSCRWCDRDASGKDTLNAVDATVRAALVARDTHVPDATSNVVGFFLMPAIAFGTDAAAARADGRIDEWSVDALVIGEATILAGDLNQLTKLIVGRERPFVHALPEEEKRRTKHPSDNNLSFFSGHTTLGFSLAASSGAVASMRGYHAAPAVWIAGMSVAAFTGYLRIAADRHYFTDVLVGAVVGAGVGVVVPYVFHRPSTGPAASPASSASPLQIAQVSGVF